MKKQSGKNKLVITNFKEFTFNQETIIGLEIHIELKNCHCDIHRIDIMRLSACLVVHVYLFWFSMVSSLIAWQWVRPQTL